MRNKSLLILVVLCAISNMQAAVIVWNSPENLVDETDVITDGALVEAFNSDRDTNSYTVNGVPFVGSDAQMVNDIPERTAVFAGGTGDPDYNSMLSSFCWGSNEIYPAVGVGGGLLVPGQAYLIQIWHADQRNANTVVYGDGNGNFTQAAEEQWVVGTFTADAAYQTITATSNAGTDTGYVNAYQIRTASSGPVPTLSTTAGDPVSGNFTVDIDFTEAVTGLEDSDFSVVNGTASNLSGSGDTYSIEINPTANGDVSVTLPADSVIDVDSEPNPESNTLVTTYVPSGSDQPIATLSTPLAEVDAPYTVHINFTEAVTGLELSDFVISNGTLSNLAGSGASYSVLVTPISPGDVTLSLPRNSVTDTDGDNLQNPASNELDTIVTGVIGNYDVLYLIGSKPPALEDLRLEDTSDAGYSQFRITLEAEGYTLTQQEAGPGSSFTLTAPYLDQFKVLILSSNNRNFSAAEAQVVWDWVNAGGGLVAWSDSAFGRDQDGDGNGDGPDSFTNTVGRDSNNSLTDQFGLFYMRDTTGRYTYGGPGQAGDYQFDHFLWKNDPVDSNIKFEGEGVSPMIVSAPTQILAYWQDADRDSGSPLIQSEDAADGATWANTAGLAIAYVGSGRVVGTFDRNTFWNNHVKTHINEWDNRQYARNLVNWAAGRDNTDLLLANFDLKPDEDDMMAAAALASMLAHPDFAGVNCYATAGAYGNQPHQFIEDAVPGLFNTLFGAENTYWTNAHANWSASVTRAKDKVVQALNAGGQVFVQEGGQSDFTYDVLQAAISSGVALSTIQSNVMVVQHTKAFNESNTTTSKLNWLKSNTVYINEDTDPGNMANGNNAGNGTPGFNSTNNTFMNQALSAGNPNATARAYWTAAINVFDNWDGSWENNTIAAGGVDFSDCVENWYIFNLGSEFNTGNADDDIAAFWSKYVTNDTTTDVNLALNGTATQSSTDYDGIPERAIDGNTSGVYGNGSVSHTATEPSPWWQVDLGAPYAIDQIQVWGRTGTHAGRLSNYDVYILDCRNNVVWSNYQASYPDPSVFLDAADTVGRYVKVQLRNDGDNEALSLAEVRVLSQDPAGYCGDLTWDGKVDLKDVAELSGGWQSGYTMDELLHIANNWLAGTGPFSLLFDGVNDYVEIADDSGLNPAANSWTTSFRMRSDTASQGTMIISKRGDAAPYPQYSIGLSSGNSYGWPAGGKITFLFREATGSEKGGYTTSDIDFSDWTHVAIVLDRVADTVHVYIDGVSVPVTLDHDGTLPTIANTSPLYIGGHPSVFNRYQGLLDEIRIYNRVLSEAEIGSIATTQDGLVAYWNLDEGSGTTAQDSVSGYTGTIYGAQWIPE